MKSLALASSWLAFFLILLLVSSPTTRAFSIQSLATRSPTTSTTSTLFLLSQTTKQADAAAEEESHTSIYSRRHVITTSAVVATLFSSLPATAATPALTAYDEDTHFSIAVPAAWTFSEQSLPDRRRIKFWKDPNSAANLMFIAYTPLRDDFTSLASFGSVEQVAEQTILPKASSSSSSVLEGGTNDDNRMFSAQSKKQAYFFDYQQETPAGVAHMETIFTMQPAAAAGKVLVTITMQGAAQDFDAALFKSVMDSYQPKKS